MIKEILLLGNPALYEISEVVREEELPEMEALERDLHDTMMEFRRIYQAGRAIAAPQIGVKKRVLYMNVGEPGLLVKVDRYRRCRIHYKDRSWQDKEMELEGDLSELLQHEYDHLDGILATMRAKDSRAFYMKN